MKKAHFFPWVISEPYPVDAIEAGIVKLPRVPVSDDAVNADAPVYRNLWDHVGKKMPKKGAGKSGDLKSSGPTCRTANCTLFTLQPLQAGI